MSRLSRLSIAVMMLAPFWSASPVHAQAARPERPYRGLFGSSQTGEVRQSVNLSGSVGAGYDTSLSSDLRNLLIGSVPRNLGSGSFGQFSGALSYLFSADRANINASAGSSGRYYPKNGRDIIRRDRVSLNGSSQLGAGFALTAGASYHPYTFSSIYSELASTGAEPTLRDDPFDLTASPEHVVSYHGGLAWSAQVSRRTSLNANYRYNGRSAGEDVPRHYASEAGGGFRYNIGRGLDFKLGYRYVEAHYGSGDPSVNHFINAGVDFERSLSISRRTTLSFSTGTAAADDPAEGTGLKFRVIGDVALTREIGRTWATSVAYVRNLRFDEGFGEPIFTDTAAATFGGLVNRRISVSSSAGASFGHATSGGRRNYEAYFGAAGLSIALNRFMSLGTSYQYRFHDLRTDLADRSRIVPFLHRHSLNVNLSVGVPLFQQRKRQS